jgi:glycosyltransferase involved in cell wall biosynthesis
MAISDPSPQDDSGAAPANVPTPPAPPGGPGSGPGAGRGGPVGAPGAAAPAGGERDATPGGARRRGSAPRGSRPAAPSGARSAGAAPSGASSAGAGPGSAARGGLGDVRANRIGRAAGGLPGWARGGVARAVYLAALPVLRWFSPRRLGATAAFVVEIARQIRRRRAEPRLTVAVDVDALYETLTGVGWYLYEILAHLAQRDDLRLRLYGHSMAPPGPLAAGGPSPGAKLAASIETLPMDDADRQAPPAPATLLVPAALLAPGAPVVPAAQLPAGPAIEQVFYSAPDGLVVPPWRADQWLRRAAPLLLAADRNRVLFGPNFLLPPLFRFAAGARVVAIHDLAFRRLPGVVRPDTARALVDGLERTLLEADLLLADSQAVAGELVADGVAPARVRSIHLGPGHMPPPSVLAAASPPPGTPARYGLFVGTLEPRKNVETLLAAWRELRRDGDAPQLLLCGPRGWRAQALRRQIAEAESEGWLRYLGYVSPIELAALYRGAAVVALPSLYEGFGMPAVEAMAAGAALVLADLPVFREVAGDAALYAPARRPDLWRERLRRVLGDEALRLTLSRRARERGARFDWQRAAAATAEAWRDAAGAAPE